MKRFLFLFLLSIIAGCGTDKTRVVEIDRTLDSLRTVFAPDPWTSVFAVVAEESDRDIILKGEVDDLKDKVAVLASLRKFNDQVLIDSIVILPDENLEPKIYGIVDVSVASMYASPRYASELVNQVLLGHTVAVLKKSHGWYYVKSTPQAPFDKGYLGWIDSDNIVRVDSSALNAYTVERKIIVTSIFSTLRSSVNGGATISDVVMADLLKPVSSTRLSRKGSSTSFEVKLPDGRIGYVSRSDAEYFDEYSSTHKPTSDGIESLAKRFIGFPYLWGGTSTKGLDCSGFVKTVFRMNDINLPRDASQQVDIGDSINPGIDFVNLRKGDLLFFGQKEEPGKPEKIVHVGIYLGGGYFIHSSSLVRINSLVKTDSSFDEYELDRFVEARRILPFGNEPRSTN